MPTCLASLALSITSQQQRFFDTRPRDRSTGEKVISAIQMMSPESHPTFPVPTAMSLSTMTTLHARQLTLRAGRTPLTALSFRLGPARRLLSYSPIRKASETNPSTSSLAPSSRLARAYPRLVQLSARTGVPLPSLGISFLILHELTAFIPLILFFYLFQAIGVGVGLLSWIRGTAGVEADTATNSTGNTEPATGAQHIGGTTGKTETAGAGARWKGVVRGWYEEGEKRVERVGKKYGILGYDKLDKSISAAPTGIDRAIGEAVSTEVGKDIQHSGATGSKAAEAVANAISAYVVVKVSSDRLLTGGVSTRPDCRLYYLCV